LLDVKAMGFNMIRFIWGGAQRYQLDLCDEIGLNGLRRVVCFGFDGRFAEDARTLRSFGK